MTIIENLSEVLHDLYGNEKEELSKQINRYSELYECFIEKFERSDVFLFSAPGRTELSGNHTDHNLGKVIEGSGNLDSIAVASNNEDVTIVSYSDG